jgi:hypothetical protein
MKLEIATAIALLLVTTCVCDTGLDGARPARMAQHLRAGDVIAGEILSDWTPLRDEIPCNMESCPIPESPAAVPRGVAHRAPPAKATVSPPAQAEPAPPPADRVVKKRTAGAQKVTQTARPHREPARRTAPRKHAPRDVRGDPHEVERAVAATSMGVGASALMFAAISLIATADAPTSESMTYSGIAFGVGVAGLVAGGVVWTLYDHDEVIQVGVSPGAFELHGSF